MANFFEWVTSLFEWFLALSLTGGIVYLCARLFEKPMIRRMKKSWIYNGYRMLLTLWVVPYGYILCEALKNIVYRETVQTVAYNMMESAFSTQRKYEMTQRFPSDGGSSFLSTAILMVSILWFAGACIFLLHFLISYENQKRYLQKSTIENRCLQEMAQSIQMRCMYGRPVKVFMNPDIKSPLLLGFWSHTILLPNVALNECELEMILKHEWIHLRRMDNVALWVAQIIRCIHWFNPLAYLFQKEMMRFCEDSCDEQVIYDMDDGERKQYGLTIVKILEQTANKEERNMKAISALNSQYKRIEERIRNIVVRQKERKLRSALWVICLAIVISLCGSMMVSALTKPDSQAWWEGGTRPMLRSPNAHGLVYLTYYEGLDMNILLAAQQQYQQIVGGSFIIENGDTATFYKEDGKPWDLKKGNVVKITVKADPGTSNASSRGELGIGYNSGGVAFDSTNKQNLIEDFYVKSKDDTKQISFVVPEDGEYSFTIRDYSSERITLTHVNIHD